jgi:hypothetical protein
MGNSVIDSFWEWWCAAGAVAVAGAIEAGEPEASVPLLGPRVEAIHPGLSWELGPGEVSQHRLVVSGDSDTRAVARRWLRAAPAPDAVWCYADTRQRRPLGQFRLGVGSTLVYYADVNVAARRRGNRLDVQVHHPSFAGLEKRQ